MHLMEKWRASYLGRQDTMMSRNDQFEARYSFVIEGGVLKEYQLKINCRYMIVPEGVRELGSGIFEKCEKLESINVDPDNPFFTSRECHGYR